MQAASVLEEKAHRLCHLPGRRLFLSCPLVRSDRGQFTFLLFPHFWKKNNSSDFCL